MRNAEETLELFKQAIEKRRAYLRRRAVAIKEAQAKSEKKRGVPPYYYLDALRGGMMSELTTLNGILLGIEKGDFHPDELYNPEDDMDGVY